AKYGANLADQSFATVRQGSRATPETRLTALIFERHHLALVGPTARDADRRAIERREEKGTRHVAADLVEQRLKSEVDPGGRRRIVVCRQEQFWFEQFDERPRVADLRIGDRVDLISHGGHVDRPELFGERPHARRDRSGAADEDGFESGGKGQTVRERAL